MAYDLSALKAQRDNPHAWAIILAGGHGTRLAKTLAGTPKQMLMWRGRPLFWHSARAFSHCTCVDGLVFVFPEELCQTAEKLIRQYGEEDCIGLPWGIVPGGKTRADSSWNGFRAIPCGIERVLVHDAARPFIKPEFIWKIWDGLDDAFQGVVPALPLKETVKVIDADGVILDTPERSRLVSVQTPQAFDACALQQAFAAFRESAVTDDAMLLEKAGFAVKTVPGDPRNIKITSEEDLIFLREEKKMITCAGFGYDVHQFGPGRPLIIGGIPIPGPLSVSAHSDGDVLLHALMDAILGCAGLGDIGIHFPDNDPDMEGISSAVLLDRVLELAANASLKLVNADLTIVAQKPKIQPFRQAIAKNIANLLGLPHDRVNLKATTEERMGFTGRCEGIKAYALVTAERPE